jgi:hypothetical protein
MFTNYTRNLVSITILVHLDFATSLMSCTFILKLPEMIAVAAACVNILTFFIMLRLKNLVNYLSKLFVYNLSLGLSPFGEDNKTFKK